MSLLPKPIKIKKAAEMLDISVDSIRKRCAGTESLRLFKRGGLWFTFLADVEKLLKKDEEKAI